MKTFQYPNDTGERGSAVVAALVAASVLALLAGAALTMNTAVSQESQSARHETSALLLAEAGVSEALVAVRGALERKEDVPAAIGSEDGMRTMRGGGYWVTVTANADGSYRLVSTGSANRSERTLEAVLVGAKGGIYANAIFAGNSSGDPNYTLRLSGTGASKDEVVGDLFSGGNVLLDDDATVSGQVSATGTITGTTGTEGAKQAIPDLAAMDYANTADYDVVKLFSGATYLSDDAGGKAYQVPEANPAHIFRLNPSDRAGLNSSTVKADYYLEDPYEPVREDKYQDGADPFIVSLSGDSGESKVFYIDGNVWINNHPTFSFQFVNESGQPVRVTFVVKGNIYFTDNIFYKDDDHDGVAWIALKDENVQDSGNVYFGDPSGGTLEYMDSFMYAENNFVDNHLDSSGSKHVKLHGNMTAGNQVAIKRDFKKSDGTIVHSKLEVELDTRIMNGTLEMPGLPANQGTGDEELSVVSWREVVRS